MQVELLRKELELRREAAVTKIQSCMRLWQHWLFSVV